MSKSEDTKQLILDTAKKEFMEKGYNDASVRSIAKQAGLTTGAIFRYFADKESLFAALVSPVADHTIASVTDIFELRSCHFVAFSAPGTLDP